MPLARFPDRRVLAAAALLATGPLLAQQPWNISLRDGLLSIRANEAPVADLAAALAAETGISVVVTGDTDASITTEIVDEPLAKAIALLSPNHLLVRESEATDAVVVEAVLMLDDAADGGGGGDGFLPSGAPADEIAGGGEVLPLEESGFEEPVYEEPVFEEPVYEEPVYEDAGDGSLPDDGLGPESELPAVR